MLYLILGVLGLLLVIMLMAFSLMAAGTAGVAQGVQEKSPFKIGVSVVALVMGVIVFNSFCGPGIPPRPTPSSATAAPAGPPATTSPSARLTPAR